MNQYNIIITEQAKTHIKKTYDFLLDQTSSKEIAVRISNAIYAKISSLSFMPQMYQVYHKEYRVVNYKSYKIFYKIHEKEHTVIIYHVLNHSQNYIQYT